MPKANKAYTHSHDVLEDGCVVFKCSTDQRDWPWLSLPYFHPVTVQSINYFASVEASSALATADADKWTALTQMRWQCGNQEAGPATHGIFEKKDHGNSVGYAMSFFGTAGELVYRMRGKGVVFRTRDFEAWRGKDKPTTKEVLPIEYASALALGVQTDIERFVSPLSDFDDPFVTALITRRNGLPPEHPYLDGSGDHVNSTHLVEVGRQFVGLLKNGVPFTVTGGEMSFSRYVELAVPFRVTLSKAVSADPSICMTVRQLDKLCATISFRCHNA